MRGRSHARLLAAAGAALLLSCSPTTPGGYPNVRGTYGSPRMWATEFTLSDGAAHFSECGGSITIDRQDERFLGGRFAVGGGPCALVRVVRGEAMGEVDTAGNITLDLRSDDAFQGFAGCEYVSGERLWTGRVAGEELSAHIEVTLTCTTPGTPPMRVHARSTATGELFPGSR